MTTPKPTRDGVWLDDLVEGATYTTDKYELTADAIAAFARDFDPQPFHTDAEAARGTFFDGLAASGWHTAAITMRLVVTGGPPIATGIVGGGADITWPSAARAGGRPAGQATRAASSTAWRYCPTPPPIPRRRRYEH